MCLSVGLASTTLPTAVRRTWTWTTLVLTSTTTLASAPLHPSFCQQACPHVVTSSAYGLKGFFSVPKVFQMFWDRRKKIELLQRQLVSRKAESQNFWRICHVWNGVVSRVNLCSTFLNTTKGEKHEMQTLKNVFPKIYDFENLFSAYKAAISCKRYRADVMEYTHKLEENLIELQNEFIWDRKSVV